MNLNEIKELLVAFDQSSLEKLELEKNDFILKLAKPEQKLDQIVYAPNESQITPAAVNVMEVASETIPVDKQVEGTKISDQKKGMSVVAPLVGVFYEASEPEAEPFVKVGQWINEGDTICIIEAMKVLNEIKAPVSGVVEQIYVKNGDIVQFDQMLMEIGD